MVLEHRPRELRRRVLGARLAAQDGAARHGVRVVEDGGWFGSAQGAGVAVGRAAEPVDDAGGVEGVAALQRGLGVLVREGAQADAARGIRLAHLFSMGASIFTHTYRRGAGRRGAPRQ